MGSGRMRYVGCLAGLALLLAACGGSTDPADEASAAPEAADPSAASPGSDSGDATASRSPAEIYEELSALPVEERMALLEERALEEGAVLLYGASNVEVQEAWSEGFQELYPDINMLYVRSKSEDLGVRVEAEARAERHLADVIETSPEVALSLRDAGLLADHHGVPIPEGYPTETFANDWYATDYLIPNLVVWNTDLVSPEEAPKSLDDLLDPKWKGKVAIDGAPQAFVQGLIIARGEDGAEDYLRTLIEDNEALVRNGHTNMTNMLAAGEFPIAVELYSHKVEQLIVEKDAPLEWLAPEPTAGHSTGISIYAHSPRPHAAALLMHYILSAPGGSQDLADVGGLAVHPDVVMPYPRLQEFLVEGSELQQRLLPLTPEKIEESGAQALEMIERLVTPHVVE